MDPDVDRSDRKEYLKARSNALPTDYQAAVFILEPGKCELSLEPREHFLDWSTAVFLGLPDPLRDLRPNPVLPQLLPQRFRIIAFIRREDPKAFAGPAPLARGYLDRIQQRQHVGALLPVGRRGPIRQGHATSVREAVDQDPFALPAAGDARAATLARGKKRRPRRHTPNESSLFPRLRPEFALAWRPTCPIRLPALQPAMRRTLRGPLRPPRDITPAAASNQDIEQRIHDLPKRRMRHPTATLLGCGGKDNLEQAPL